MTDTKAHTAVTADAPDPQPTVTAAREPDFAPVIRSKIQPPPLRSTTLTRQRLIDRLHEATQSRVTLLVAEAGYGKTTLLADFAARSGQRTLWYRLDPTDGDAITWTNYLIAACREVDPIFGAATLRILSHLKAGSPPRSVFVDSLVGELAAWTAAPTTLVLDDFHRIDRSSEACEVVRRLIESAPPWLKIVISTRRRPALEMARLAAAGEVIEIGLEELRFSEAETARLFSESYRRPLHQDVIRSIDRRTRGWAASLALVYGSIRDKTTGETLALTQALSGASAPIYDFLAEEVLSAVPEDLQSVLVRASILDSLNAERVVGLFAYEESPPSTAMALAWLDKAEDLGLISRTSRSSDLRELHPLMRDFLASRLIERLDEDAIRVLHRGIAQVVRASDPLLACKHLIDAQDPHQAMAVLESSILETLGSGQWGLASELLDRLVETHPEAGVAAIRARRLMDDGDLLGAERVLESADRAMANASNRSALHQTQLALGWRTGNRETIRTAAESLLSDDEASEDVRQIAQMFVDASQTGPGSPTLRILAARLARMSRTQAASGLDFFSAISLHNAAVAYLGAGDYSTALDSAHQAVAAFSRLRFDAVETLSTHSVMAVTLMEAGRDDEAKSHVSASMESGREFADVPASIAFAFLASGLRDEAMGLIARARALQKQGRSDVAGIEQTDMAEAFSVMAQNPREAIDLLVKDPTPTSLDLGHSIERLVMLAHAYLAAGLTEQAIEVAARGLDQARMRGERRSELRLAILLALASEDKHGVASAIREAAAGSHLALAEMADVLCDRLDLADESMGELGSAISAHSSRWLPALRQALGKGAPSGHQAAFLIDRYGESKDVGVLRAYARTYRSRGASPRLGLALARRTSPKLRIHDLGRVILEVGQRSVALSGMRRKPAALLLYLVSRTALTAHRDQAIEDLWPEADPASALNSLNQSLYFLRREIDPWYEDGVTPEYVGFESDLIWLDAELVTSDSIEFLAAAAGMKRRDANVDAQDVLRSYTGHFAPEFEYEEWALAFRSRLKSTFLETASSAVARLIRIGDIEGARGTAMATLEVEESASDIERALVWLQWRLGARSAAKAQFEHLQRVDQLDGLEPEPLTELVEGPAPIVIE